MVFRKDPRFIIIDFFLFKAALVTGKHMLALWKNLYESGIVGDNEKDFDKRSETRSVLQLYNDMDSVKDSSENISFICKKMIGQLLISSTVYSALVEMQCN